MFEEFGINAGYVEELHAQYMRSPFSVDLKWRSFFEEREGLLQGVTFNGSSAQAAYSPNGYPKADGKSQELLWPPAKDKIADKGAAEILASLTPSVADDILSSRVSQLVSAYRRRGHIMAHLDPLSSPPPLAPDFELSQFGLSEADLDHSFPTVGVEGLAERAALRQIISHLRTTYCGSIGVEYTYIEKVEAREWLRKAMESSRNQSSLNRGETLRVISRLTDAEIFEDFLAKNFIGAKRFSCEGAESMIAMLDLLIEYAGERGVDEMVLGMAHRGRLNVLVNILGKDPRELFAAFDDKKPELFMGGGDVKYHLGYSNDWSTASGKKVHLTLAFNPSHLEFVNPVVEGRVRAKQDLHPHRTVVPLLIHGDASFMGQGVVPETLNLAGLSGYHTGGTLHLVVNNQVGFTTYPQDSRSTRYCTDIARMLKVPVFHVNGEDPEAVIQVTRLAVEYRMRFGEDVVIDMFCYRRYGHNEGDEPRFTQPLMYQKIDEKMQAKMTVKEIYARKLITTGQISREQVVELELASKTRLDAALKEARGGDFLHPPHAMGGVWSSFEGGSDAKAKEVDTAYPKEALLSLLDKLAELPPSFHANEKILKLTLHARRDKARATSSSLDWGAAEHLAFASLLVEGTPVRITGQDARRGTFAHRHAVLSDAKTGERHTPLLHLKEGQAPFYVFDSPLSETGVLGFEYGYSLDRPESLVIWEAQFGDFANGAQVMIDQFLSSAEDKWRRLSGLVLLLPHGYEGQGPEHSSARIERFLQLAAEDNMQICNLTTPAQIFHVLRRQVLRKWRKPLVVFTPKSLLRHHEAVSSIDDLAYGKFQRVIADKSTEPRQVKKVLLCSGKVYYDLAETRKARGISDVAIVRVEQLYPFNDELLDVVKSYREGTPFVWVQEEPYNCGAWYYLHANLTPLLGSRFPLSVVARAASASPATGSGAAHKIEQNQILEAAFKLP